MQQISLHSPDSVQEACELLAAEPHDTTVIAGGQSLIQMFKQRLVGASKVVDVTSLEELEGIETTDDYVWVGAGETYATVREASDVQEALPVLTEMISTIGDTQIRNRGTLVGGTVHADPQGDPPILATALNATLRITSTDGERTVPAREFYSGLFETALEEHELVTKISYPIPDETTEVTYKSFTPRDGDYAVAAVVPSVSVGDSGAIESASVTVGAVGDRPEVLELECLLDVPSDQWTIDRISERISDSATVQGGEEWSEEYRRQLIDSLVADTLQNMDVPFS